MRGGFLLEHGRVAEDAVADAAELVVYGLANGFAVAVSGQCFSEFTPFETEFADFIGQVAAFGERLLDDAELVDEPSGQDEQALSLDQSDWFLLDRPVFGMRVEDAFRILVADRIVAEDEAHLIAALGDDHTG